jgi:hypothetical protein
MRRHESFRHSRPGRRPRQRRARLSALGDEFRIELNIVVMSRNVDPRSGETVYRLTSVKRGEPPP